MVLAFDIGNTNINMGLFKSGRLSLRAVFPTKKANQFKVFLKGNLFRRIDFRQLEAVVICGVVPQAARALKIALSAIRGLPIYTLGRDLIVPIKNLYLEPKNLGQDRLVNAYAGLMFYGAPLIVVDFGTAITFDVVSRKRQYLGGMILPGLGVSLDTLSKRTALLPKIKLDIPREFIGRDTKNSMLSGIVYGFSALSDGLIGWIKEKIGKDTKVIATGGDASLIKKYCKGINKLDKDLTLKGLYLAYKTCISV